MPVIALFCGESLGLQSFLVEVDPQARGEGLHSPDMTRASQPCKLTSVLHWQELLRAKGCHMLLCFVWPLGLGRDPVLGQVSQELWHTPPFLTTHL